MSKYFGLVLLCLSMFLAACNDKNAKIEKDLSDKDNLVREAITKAAAGLSAAEQKDIEKKLTVEHKQVGEALAMIKTLYPEVYDGAIAYLAMKNKEIEELKADKNAWRDNFLWAFVGFGVIGMAASVFVAVSMAGAGKFAIAGAAASGTLVACALTILKYSQVIALWSGISYLLFMGILAAVLLYRYYKTAKYAVELNEAVKPSLAPTEKARIYGTEDRLGLAHKMGSTAIDNIVQAYRKTIKK